MSDATVARPELPRTLRPRAWLVGLAGGAVTALIGGAGLISTPLLVVALVVVQFGLVAAWLGVIGAPGRVGGMIVGCGASIAADIVLANREQRPAGGLMGVLGLALVASLLHQLARRPRKQVALSMAAEMSAAVLGLCLSCVQGLTSDAVGRPGLLAFTFTLVASLPIGRFIDQKISALPLGEESQRGVFGLVGGLGAAVVVGAIIGSKHAELGTAHGELLAGSIALAAYIADAAAVRGAQDIPLRDQVRLNALRPLSVLFPIALAAPTAYVLGRLLLG